MASVRELGVDFTRRLRHWDGFGVNYVEMTHSRNGDYEDYGSFSLISASDRERALEAVFGNGGLRPGVVKLFLNPYLLEEPPEPGKVDLDAYRFDGYAPRVVEFAREGLTRSRAAGIRLRFLATLYGPPAWATRQKLVRGRDLDPAMKDALATFLVGCVRYLREREGIPVEALSLHNEGESDRWPDHPRHDFNMHWPPSQVVEFIRLVAACARRLGVRGLKVTPGETTTWADFRAYAEAIAADADALRELGLITSHGFGGRHDPAGIETIRALRPELHAWTTSASWMKTGGAGFCANFADQIYRLGLNALIPWAVIQRTPYWPEGDPNPNPPLLVARHDGQWRLRIRRPYSYYKQLTRAGAPGTAVAARGGDGDGIGLIAFADNGSGRGHSLVLANATGEAVPVKVAVKGADGPFAAAVTSPACAFEDAGSYGSKAGHIEYEAPPDSVTTFFAGR